MVVGGWWLRATGRGPWQVARGPLPVALILSSPALDRMQNQIAGEFSGFADCIKKLVASEGVGSLWKGNATTRQCWPLACDSYLGRLFRLAFPSPLFPSSLSSGYTPAVIKLAPHTVISFIMLDNLSKVMNPLKKPPTHTHPPPYPHRQSDSR